MPNKKRVIFCDLDGTLLDGWERHYKCYTDIIVEGGGVPLPKDEYRLLKRNKIPRTVLLEKSKYPLTYETFLNLWLQRIEQKEYLMLDILKPHVLETLQEWQQRQSVFLVTKRQHSDMLNCQLNALNLKQYFEDVIICDYKKKQSKINATRAVFFDKAVVVGDTEEDASVAHEKNIPFLAIKTGMREDVFLKTPYKYNDIYEIKLETWF